MYCLEIKEQEFYDYNKEEFVTIKAQTIQLEHSLLSVSKWESKWKKPFFSKEEMTREQTISYIECMTVAPKVDPMVYRLCLTNENINGIMEYIKDPMTATTFSKLNQPPSRKIITSELIYYWMTQAQIPFETEKWHLNRLMTLIEICSRESNPPKKMSQRDLAKRNRSLNAARRAKTGSRG